MDFINSHAVDYENSSRGASDGRHSTKRRFEYPSPPRQDQAEIDYVYRTDVESAIESPSKRQRIESYDLNHFLEMDFDDEDSDEDEGAFPDERGEFPSDSGESFVRTPRRGAARGRGGRGRGGRTARDSVDDDIYKRSRSEIYGRRRRDEEGRKKKKLAPRDVYEETPELRRLTGLVTKAWISEDYENALKYALEGIKIQPEAFQLHGTVAEILIKQGRTQDAMDALFSGVHASKEPGNWWFVVDRLNEINQGRDDSTIKAKLQYCYSTIVSLNPRDYQARLLRMNIYREKELYKRARNDCLALLKLKPTDAVVVEALAELTAILEDPIAAIDRFTSFMDEVLKTEKPEETSLTWNILSSYTGMLLEGEQYEKGLNQLKVISRWLLGRAEETYWDRYSDDREWDVYPDPRRQQAKEFVENKFDEITYGLGLPLELRVRLGTLRLLSEEGQFEEAMSHFEYLFGVLADDDTNKHDYIELFREAADSLRESGHHEEALQFYDALKKFDRRLNSRFYFDIAICYQALGMQEEMREAVQNMRYGERNPEMQIGLAKIYESQGRPDLMWRLCLELKKMGYSNLLQEANLPTTRPTDLSIKDENVPLPIAFSRVRTRRVKQNRPKKQYGSLSVFQKRKDEAIRDQVIRAMYDGMLSLQKPIAIGDINARSEWMRLANEIFEEFRGFARFFPSDKSKPFSGIHKGRFAVLPDLTEQAIPDQLEFEQPTSWREINLDELVDMILHYAMFLAEDGDKEQAFTVLRILESSNIVYCDAQKRYIVRATGLHCAIKLNDEAEVREGCRWFFKHFAFSTDSYRLTSALHRLIRGNYKAYTSGPEQKFYLRQIKTVDYLILKPEERAKFYFAIGNRSSVVAMGERYLTGHGNDHNVTEHDADLLALYGHLLMVSGAASTALHYYFRAYVLRPDDATLNLCMALAYLSWAWKRQAANRQYQIQQGLCFLERYGQLRRKSAQLSNENARLQEAEFNEALAYGSMGLVHLAIPKFKKCLEIGERIKKNNVKATANQKSSRIKGKGPIVQSIEVPQESVHKIEEENFGPEAAYALRNILAMNGDLHAAHEVTKQWLVL